MIEETLKKAKGLYSDIPPGSINLKEAIKLFNELAPKHLESHVLLVRAAIEHPERTAEFVTKSARELLLDMRTHNQRYSLNGVEGFEKNQYTAADKFDKVMRPLFLGILYEKIGILEKALPYYEEAIKCDNAQDGQDIKSAYGEVCYNRASFFLEPDTYNLEQAKYYLDLSITHNNDNAKKKLDEMRLNGSLEGTPLPGEPLAPVVAPSLDPLRDKEITALLKAENFQRTPFFTILKALFETHKLVEKSDLEFGNFNDFSLNIRVMIASLKALITAKKTAKFGMNDPDICSLFQKKQKTANDYENLAVLTLPLEKCYPELKENPILTLLSAQYEYLAYISDAEAHKRISLEKIFIKYVAVIDAAKTSMSARHLAFDRIKQLVDKSHAEGNGARANPSYDLTLAKYLLKNWPLGVLNRIEAMQILEDILKDPYKKLSPKIEVETRIYLARCLIEFKQDYKNAELHLVEARSRSLQHGLQFELPPSLVSYLTGSPVLHYQYLLGLRWEIYHQYEKAIDHYSCIPTIAGEKAHAECCFQYANALLKPGKSYDSERALNYLDLAINGNHFEACMKKIELCDRGIASLPKSEKIKYDIEALKIAIRCKNLEQVRIAISRIPESTKLEESVRSALTYFLPLDDAEKYDAHEFVTNQRKARDADKAFLKTRELKSLGDKNPLALGYLGEQQKAVDLLFPKEKQGASVDVLPYFFFRWANGDNAAAGFLTWLRDIKEVNTKSPSYIWITLYSVLSNITSENIQAFLDRPNASTLLNAIRTLFETDTYHNCPRFLKERLAHTLLENPLLGERYPDYKAFFCRILGIVEVPVQPLPLLPPPSALALNYRDLFTEWTKSDKTSDETLDALSQSELPKEFDEHSCWIVFYAVLSKPTPENLKLFFNRSDIQKFLLTLTDFFGANKTVSIQRFSKILCDYISHEDYKNTEIKNVFKDRFSAIAYPTPIAVEDPTPSAPPLPTPPHTAAPAPSAPPEEDEAVGPSPPSSNGDTEKELKELREENQRLREALAHKERDIQEFQEDPEAKLRRLKTQLIEAKLAKLQRDDASDAKKAEKFNLFANAGTKKSSKSAQHTRAHSLGA